MLSRVYLIGALFTAACVVSPVETQRIDYQTVDNACQGKVEGDTCEPSTVSDLRYRNLCVAGACVPTRCGDGVIDVTAGEECDDRNGVQGDGCEPDDCKFSCNADAQCNDGDSCNGNETCDGSMHRCVTSAPQTQDSACTFKPLGSASSRSGVCKLDDNGANPACVPTLCLNRVVNTGTPEECDDGNFLDDDGCDRHCAFSCNSTIYRQASCAPIYCDLFGTREYAPQCTNMMTNNVVTGKRCQLAGLNGNLCSGYETRLTNDCSAAQCIDGIGCAHVPLWRTRDNGPVDTPAMSKTGIWNRTLRERYEKMKRDGCDPSCDKDAQPADLPRDQFGATEALPYCQRIGAFTAAQPRCYTSFDYDCDGRVDTSHPVCRVSIRNPGWVLGDESRCGTEGTRIEVNASDAPICEQTLSTSIVECK